MSSVRGWQESDLALDDLVHCPHPRLSGEIDSPLPVDRWWTRNNVPINAASLTRADLFAMAEKARTAERPDWVDVLLHVLAWGVVGDLRNTPTIVRSAEADRRRLNDLLAGAAESSYRGMVAAAYTVLYKKVPRLGPAFFSKFLYVTGDRTSTSPRCLILDSRVATALFTLTGQAFGVEKPSAYAAYCDVVHRCAQRQGRTPDEVEFRLYQFGALTRYRWRWLHAEASLYREGNREVSFDDIVARLAA